GSCLRLLRLGLGGLGLGLFLVFLLLSLLIALVSLVRLLGLFADRLAHRHAVVEAEHDDDDVRLLGGEDLLCRGRPIIRFALGLIADQARIVLGLADHAHVGLLGVGIFESVGEPVRHAVAHHHDVAFGNGLALLRRRRLGEILVDALGLLLLERLEEIAAK